MLNLPPSVSCICVVQEQKATVTKSAGLIEQSILLWFLKPHNAAKHHRRKQQTTVLFSSCKSKWPNSFLIFRMGINAVWHADLWSAVCFSCKWITDTNRTPEAKMAPINFSVKVVHAVPARGRYGSNGFDPVLWKSYPNLMCINSFSNKKRPDLKGQIRSSLNEPEDNQTWSRMCWTWTDPNHESMIRHQLTNRAAVIFPSLHSSHSVSQRLCLDPLRYQTHWDTDLRPAACLQLEVIIIEINDAFPVQTSLISSPKLV